VFYQKNICQLIYHYQKVYQLLVDYFLFYFQSIIKNKGSINLIERKIITDQKEFSFFINAVLIHGEMTDLKES